MKTTKIKSSVSGVTLAHPLARAGWQPNSPIIVYEVNDVPDDVHASDVLRLFDATATIRHQGHASDDTANPSHYTYRYDELGVGKIVR